MTTATLQQIESKLTLSIAGLIAGCAIAISFQAAGNASLSTLGNDTQPVQQVVIEGQRMSADEKLAFDEQTLGIARVEVIGKRLTPAEKQAMDNADMVAAGQDIGRHKV